MEPLFPIIHEDGNLLVIDKPAGLVCHPTKEDARSSLIGRIRLHLGPEIQPHMINRLDRETSGVVIVAKNIETARSLRRLWERRHVRKLYLGIVHGFLPDATGVIDAALGPDEHARVSIKNCARPDGASASTAFRVLNRFRRSEGEFSLLEIEPITGRKHQIRIHLAHIGYPIVGDKLYGGDENLYLDFVYGRLSPDQRKHLILENHALHANCISFEHNNFHATLPSNLISFCESIPIPQQGANSPSVASGSRD